MKRKTAIIGLAAPYLSDAGAVLAQSLSLYGSLKMLRLTRMPRQRMVIAEAKRDPNVVGKVAFGRLFKTLFSLKGVRMKAPRAHWTNIATNLLDKKPHLLMLIG